MKRSITVIALCLLFSSFIKAQQYDGYTLVAVQNQATTTLIDTNGTTFKTWTHATAKKTGYSSYLMPGGYLWRTVAKTGNSFSGGPVCGEVMKVDYSGTVLWDFVYSTTQYCTHHDICPMPNGNVLLIAYELKTSAEVTAAGCSTFSGAMWPERVVEVQPTGATTGTVVWEWHVWDHLCQSTNSSGANYVTSIVNNPQLLNINYNAQKDWMHMNGICYNPILDQITVSSHALNEIYVIDHSTTSAEAASHTGGNAGKGGDFLYRWGNPAAYGASGTTIINVVHDAHWIPEGSPNAGRLVYFNNNGVSSSKSSIDQIIPPLNGYNYNLSLGSAYAPSTYDARHACNGHAQDMGNSQQLPNGNMLVCIATSGLIYETNPSGTSIWSKTISGSVPKAFRYSNCYITNQPPPIPTITENLGILTSSAATTYQWYKNGQLITGETSQTYTPTDTAIYLVRTTDSNGCVYEYSAGYYFTYSATSTYDFNKISNNLEIYPNPSSNIFNISLPSDDLKYNVEVYNALGKIILQKTNLRTFNLNDYESGLYFVVLTFNNNNKIIKKISLIK